MLDSGFIFFFPPSWIHNSALQVQSFWVGGMRLDRDGDGTSLPGNQSNPGFCIILSYFLKDLSSGVDVSFVNVCVAGFLVK